MSLTGRVGGYKKTIRKRKKKSVLYITGARSGQFFFLLFLKNDSPFVRCDAPSSRSLALPSYMFDCCLSLFPLVWKSPFSPWSRIFNESPLSFSPLVVMTQLNNELSCWRWKAAVYFLIESQENQTFFWGVLYLISSVLCVQCIMHTYI